MQSLPLQHHIIPFRRKKPYHCQFLSLPLQSKNSMVKRRDTVGGPYRQSQTRSGYGMAEKRKRKPNAFLEWLMIAVILFFLYDIIWILADWDDFKQTISENGMKEISIDFMLCGIFSLASWTVNKWLFVHRFLGGERQGHTWLVLNGVLVMAFNMAVAVGCELLLNVLLPTFQAEDIWGNSFLFGIIASMVALIQLSMHFSDIIILKGKENLALQKKYLKLQMDPHFVFNSLSSLAGMIEENPAMAEDYVVKLSHIYRYILRNIDKDYIAVGDGADFVKAYVDFLNIRYDGNIVFTADGLYWGRGECILSLSLQLLVENAVKHNSPQSGDTLRIELTRQGDMLVVRNNRIYTNDRNGQNIESYGIGISNLTQRYGLECREKPEFVGTHDAFEVKLPIIKRKTDEL